MWIRLRPAAALAATLTLGLTLAGCTGRGDDPAPATSMDAGALTEPVTLKVATLPSLSLGVLMVANHRGYFQQEKITLTTETVQNSQDAIALLARGQLDAAVGSLSAGLFNSINTGLDVRAVSAMSTIAQVPGVAEAPSGVFIRKELAPSGKATYADLKGKSVAAAGGLGTATSYLLGLYAKKGGYTLTDLPLKSLSIADAVTGMKSGSVDAAFLTSPYSTQAVTGGIGVEVGNAREVYANETQAALMFGPNLLRNNKAAGVAFMRAMLRAAADMQGDYRTNEAVVTALSTTLNMKPENVKSFPPYFVPADLAMNPATITEFQNMFLALSRGGDKVLSYTDPMPLDRILDDSFRKQAQATAK
jgi:NitT/TauT family transport system substrate-binding protein